jgi:hypothetical protein
MTPDVRVTCKQFAVNMLHKLDEDNGFLRKIIFSDEDVSWKVNNQNACVCKSEHRHATAEHNTGSPTVVWCGVLQDHLVGPFFCAESTVLSTSYFNMR